MVRLVISRSLAIDFFFSFLESPNVFKEERDYAQLTLDRVLILTLFKNTTAESATPTAA